MPKQKKPGNRAAFISRRQSANQERQKGFRKLLITIIAVVIVVVLGVVGWSVWNFQFKPYDQTVLTFNGVSYNMRYFINTLKVYYGKAPSSTTISTFADYVEQQIERNQTIIQGSQALGINVSRSDTEQKLKNAGLPDNREAVDVALAQRILSEQVPESQAQAHVQAMFLESEAAAQAAIARVKAGESFGAVANETSKLPLDLIVDGDMGWVTPRLADITVNSTMLGGLIANSANGTLNGPYYDGNVNKQYGYWVAEAVARKYATDNTSVDQMHLMGLLLGNEQDARAAMAKMSAGANVTELAQQLSQSPSVPLNGADIGWISKGQSPDQFGQVFNLPLNTPVGPFSENTTPTKGGWWVFRVVNKAATRALDESQFKALENDFISRCTAALKQNHGYKVDNLLTEQTKAFALNEVVKSIGKGAVLIDTATLPDGEAGVPYSAQLTAYGDTQGATWSLTQGSLPQGLVLNTVTGVISGTPKLAGGSGFTVMVESKIHHDTKELVLRVRLAITIETTSLPDGQVGTTYSTSLKARTDADTYKWSITNGSLPDGIELNAQSGTLYGKPTAAGTYPFTVQVDDGLKTASQPLTITVVSANTTSTANVTP